MTNEQILKKAIEKAGKNGYEYTSITEELLKQIFDDNKYYVVIFSHDFAKAFWGNKWGWNTKGWYIVDGWRGHLGAMVLEEEPLKYIEKFIKEESHAI